MKRNIQTKLLQVKPFQETLRGGYCGPASLKIVLDYYGMRKSEKEIANRCGRNSKLGTDDISIKRVAESYGLKAEIKNEATFADIEKWLTRGIPVIVNWFTRGRSDYSDSEIADGHYSIVMGLDKSNIYLQDPEIGAMRAIKRNDFLSVWFDFRKDYITSWKDMILRQIIAVYPKTHKGKR
ncbi:MAG: C39 family peptidase [Candidatus Wildermuthbacteria bacterium]|nr:C39 family peptidase [Candidatus Wildermuthbacteria bacterium]